MSTVTPDHRRTVQATEAPSRDHRRWRRIVFCRCDFTKLGRHLACPWKRDHRKGGDLMIQLHVERTIAASPEQVFDWLADPANLTASPMVLKAGWAKGS